MKLDAESVSLEGVASVLLAVGLVTAYFFGSYRLSNANAAPHAENSSDPVGIQSTEGKKKRKKGKTEGPPLQTTDNEPRLPGGNGAFSGSRDTDIEDPALVIASIDAGLAAQEHRNKAKKAKKKAKVLKSETSHLVAQNKSAPSFKSKSKEFVPNLALDREAGGEGEWRVVGRSRKTASMEDSQASYTTTSATDPGSPKEIISPTPVLETMNGLKQSDSGGEITGQSFVESDDEPSQNPLTDSRNLGLILEGIGEESTEDNGFVPVKSKGRRRAQRSASSQSIGGGSGIRATEGMTKKQRQNRNKRETEKAAKALADQQQQAALVRHKSELKNARIEEMYKKGKKLSGGMSMSVGESGKAEWD